MRRIEDKAFLLLVVAVSLAFVWIVLPFYGAVLWGTVGAILFAPICRRLTVAMGQHRNLAALATVAIVVASVILPVLLIGLALSQEAAAVFKKAKAGELDLARSFQLIRDTLPAWAAAVLDSLGLGSLDDLQERVSASLLKGSEFLTSQAVSFGLGTFDFVANLFVMLYLLFYLLRDETTLVATLKRAIPLWPEQQQALMRKFAIVVRATVKGDLLVALLQGALGGLIFWVLGIGGALLWAVVMALLSLLPVVGAALVWLPVALYLLASGAVWQGLVLIAYGALVIGLVDNFLRPMLVGQDTKMPGYVVLISTLGGIATFGLNGFVLGPAIAAMFIAVWDIFRHRGSPGRAATAPEAPAPGKTVPDISYQPP